MSEDNTDSTLEIQQQDLEQIMSNDSTGKVSEGDKAREIVKRISNAALELAFVRHDITSDEVDVDEDADVKVRVAANEEFMERVKEDTLNCLTGDDFGCLDPEELDESTCELLWLESALAAVRKDQIATDIQVIDAKCEEYGVAHNARLAIVNAIWAAAN